MVNGAGQLVMDYSVVEGSSQQEEKMDGGKAWREILWGSEQVNKEGAFPAGTS